MLTQIRSLTQAQQLEVSNFLNKMFEGNLEQKLNDGVSSCPHCNSASFHKIGKTRGKQRYKCSDCSKTFGDSNKTAFYCSKKSLATWNHYIELMFSDSAPMSVRGMAKHIGIHYVTSFYWRQKILHALKQMQPATLDGIVEADETYFNLSFKGQRNLSKEWKERKIKRGISDQKVCVFTAMDRRRKTMLLQSTCLGRPSIDQITEVLAPHIAKGAILVTDRHNAYPGTAENLELTHEALRSATEVRRAYHVQNVNSMHSHLKNFMRPFRGVATKYLDNYLAYYKWNAQHLNMLPVLAQPAASVTRRQLRLTRMTLK